MTCPVFLLQDSGTHLAVIDDCNDHMLTVWDWQKKSKIAEIKVRETWGVFLCCAILPKIRKGFDDLVLEKKKMLDCFHLLQSTNEVVLAVEFHPTDANTIVTCGKSHIFFWTWAGTSLARKQGIFGVRTFFTCSVLKNHFIYLKRSA